MNVNFQNPEIALLARDSYSKSDLSRLEHELGQHGTLTFSRLPSGLFSASSAGDAIADSGYGNVWVRDNIYVGYAHLVQGETEIAAGLARTLLRFYDLHRRRFEDIISGAVDPSEASNRPYIRFDGTRLEEIPERWPHAQNDALGYFLWLTAQLARLGHLVLTPREISTLMLLPPYFKAIEYWQDEDSGHWEEVRKISASSIGTVVAGLEELCRLARERPGQAGGAGFPVDLLDLATDLAARGRQTLAALLPQECSQLLPEKNRRYDSALVFLLYPLEIIQGPLATLVLHDVRQFLTGQFGIRRYLRDSYYAPDFDREYSKERRTTDHSGGTGERDVLLQDVGEEAQWCIFDPMLSAYYGSRFLKTGAAEDAANQIHHLNRSLAQITPDWKCPELYYLQSCDDRRGQRAFKPNRHLPLQWTQANLVVALEALRATLR